MSRAPLDKLPKAIAILFLSAVLFLAFPLLASAQDGSSFYWDSIAARIDVQENGDMLITERHVYVFVAPHTNQRYRRIPLDRVDEIDNVSVYQDGVRLQIQTEVEDGELWIRWSHDLNPPETHTFQIRYRVRGGLQRTGSAGGFPQVRDARNIRTAQSGSRRRFLPLDFPPAQPRRVGSALLGYSSDGAAEGGTAYSY